MESLARLRSRSCIIDGEAVACDDNGLASFEHIRYRQHDGDVFLYAFDLIELNGDDLRRDPLQVRKATLTSILARARPGSDLRSRYLPTVSSSASLRPLMKREIMPGQRSRLPYRAVGIRAWRCSNRCSWAMTPAHDLPHLDRDHVLNLILVLEEILARNAVALGEPHQAAFVADQALVDVVELLDQRVDARLIEP